MTFRSISHLLRASCAWSPIDQLQHIGKRVAARIAALAFITLLSSLSYAQTAHFSGSEYTMPVTGVTNPEAIAIDTAGNLYVAYPYSNQVFKQTWTAAGFTYTAIGTGLKSPSGIAVDLHGNVYISDSGNQRLLKETVSGTSYTQSVISSSIGTPASLAVDLQGNLYVVDSAYDRVYKETVTGSVYVQSSIGSNLVLPNSVAVDAAGNVYISDPVTPYSFFPYQYNLDGVVYKETPNGGSYTQSVVISGYNDPVNVSVDGSGNIYISLYGTQDDAEASQVLKEVPSGGGYTQSLVGPDEYYFVSPVEANADAAGNLYIGRFDSIVKVTSAAGDLGDVNVGTQSNNVSLIFTFDSAASGLQAQVVSEDATNPTFANVGTEVPACGNGESYGASASCLVNVAVTPLLPGAQRGAAELRSSTGSLIATGYVHANGVAPRVNFSPGTQSTLQFSGQVNPLAITSDLSGNLYIASASAADNVCTQGSVLKETLTGGSYQPTTVATGLSCPVAVAVDGAGNIFIGEQNGFDVIEESPAGNGTYTQSVPFKNLGNIESVAVDDSGNVYIGSAVDGLLKETLTATGYVQSTVAPNSDISSPTGVAIDAGGNLYVADRLNNRVMKETAFGGTYTESTLVGDLNGPEQVAVDLNGNVFITDTDNARVIKESPAGDSYTQSTVWSGLKNPVGIALDGHGNVLISSEALNSVFKLDVVDPPSVTFPLTGVGSTSEPQSVTLVNSGNADLSFPIPASGSNPSLTSFFTLDGSGSEACPSVGINASASATLAAGSTCSLTISFAPAATSDLAGTLVLTDNNLNATAPGYAQQSISLSGTAGPGSGLAFAAIPPQVYGNSPFTISATSHSNGAITYEVVSGPATVSGATVTLTGAGTVVLSASQAASGSYGATTVTTNFVVAPAVPALSFAPIAAQTDGAAPFTVSATSVSSGAITYSVVSGPATISGATVTLAGAGTVVLNAVQAASGNYASATATTSFTVAPEMFTLGSGSNATSATTSSGGKATYSLTLTPQSGETFPNAVSFSLTGLPPGATASFSPSSISAGSGKTTITLTVQLGATQTARADKFITRGSLPALALGVLLLPFAGMRSARRRLRQKSALFMPVLIVGFALGTLAALSGCGGGGSTGSSTSTTTSGSTAPASETYSLTVTATDAVAGANSSTALTLTVQ
ncbi:hypothetical protein [Silvibacterium acidisoli]|uniref:hypothetical protein n=1 Tax=Acidobacteriaceae bacterium ZG23-2 TaxID=2883246 RepID=UPI00406CA97D